jgi:hypothetical protein
VLRFLIDGILQYDSQPLISVKDLKKFFEKASASRNANENFNNNNRLSSRHESISNLRVKTDQAQNIENDIRELSHVRHGINYLGDSFIVESYDLVWNICIIRIIFLCYSFHALNDHMYQ